MRAYTAHCVAERRRARRDVATGACTAVLEGHTDAVYALCDLSLGRILSGDSAGTLRVWDAASGACLAAQERAHGGEAVLALCGLPGSRAASGGHDGCVRIWAWDHGNQALQPECGPLAGHGGSVWALALAEPGGSRLLSGSLDCTLRLWQWLPPQPPQPGRALQPQQHQQQQHQHQQQQQHQQQRGQQGAAAHGQAQMPHRRLGPEQLPAQGLAGSSLWAGAPAQHGSNPAVSGGSLASNHAALRQAHAPAEAAYAAHAAYAAYAAQQAGDAREQQHGWGPHGGAQGGMQQGADGFAFGTRSLRHGSVRINGTSSGGAQLHVLPRAELPQHGGLAYSPPGSLAGGWQGAHADGSHRGRHYNGTLQIGGQIGGQAPHGRSAWVARALLEGQHATGVIAVAVVRRPPRRDAPKPNPSHRAASSWFVQRASFAGHHATPLAAADAWL